MWILGITYRLIKNNQKIKLSTACVNCEEVQEEREGEEYF